MNVVLNGERRELEEGATVRSVVSAAGAPEEGREPAVDLRDALLGNRDCDLLVGH